MYRRVLLAAVPAVVLAGCATRLGLADRLEVRHKTLRLYPHDDDADPTDAAVQRYDPADGTVSTDVHDDLADDLPDADGRLVVETDLANRLGAEFDVVEYRVGVCDLEGEDCELTTLVREDFNEVDAGDVVDLVSRSSGSGLVEVHERREQRD